MSKKIQKVIRSLDIYRNYEPQTEEDWQHIIMLAKALLKEAGVK